MAEVTVSPGSWLNLADLLEYKGLLFWSQTEFPSIPFSDDDQYVALTQEQAKRLDLVAYDTWGDPELIWVVLLANGLDLPNQAREGMTIRLPAKQTIDDLLKPQQ